MIDLSTELSWIRIKLTQWGRISRAVGIGYPTMAATEKARIGRGGSFGGPSLPPDLEAIDIAVTRAPTDYRIVLVEHYTKRGDWREHAARLGWGEATYFRRKKTAEVYLNTQVTSANGMSTLRAS